MRSPSSFVTPAVDLPTDLASLTVHLPLPAGGEVTLRASKAVEDLDQLGAVLVLGEERVVAADGVD